MTRPTGTQARSSVRSRLSSPGWKSASEIFKSPPPKRIITRRTSILYKKQQDLIDELDIDDLITKALSSPGVKTRARRTSVYQRRPSKLLSPLQTRARRASVYLPKGEVFTTIWPTPVMKQEPILEASPVSPVNRKVSVKNSAKKASTTSEMKEVIMTPVSTRARSAATPASMTKLKIKKVVSTKSASETNIKKDMQEEAPCCSTSTVTKKVTHAVKKVSQEESPCCSTSIAPVKKSKRSAVLTSTPAKSLKEISGKSFYSTPGETPIQNDATNDVFVFSAIVSQSVKRSARKAVSSTASTGKQLPKKRINGTPHIKSPVSKRKHESPDVGLDFTEPTPKRTKATTQRHMKIAMRTMSEKRSTPAMENVNRVVVAQSASNVRKEAVRKSEKRKASDTPTVRQTKQAKVAKDSSDQPTQRIVKVAKRTSPKKLLKIVDSNQSNELDFHPAASHDVSVLDQTFEMDSRSSRCTIL